MLSFDYASYTNLIWAPLGLFCSQARPRYTDKICHTQPNHIYNYHITPTGMGCVCQNKTPSPLSPQPYLSCAVYTG